MIAHASIRHILKQVAATSKQSIEGGDLSGEELDALRSFTSDVEKVISKLDRPVPAITKQTLFQDLLNLRKRCTGLLEPFRGRIEDALSAVETITT